jgi:broad specificity phosphatase PhoE
MIIRHGEKPDGTHPGIDANGRPDPGSLSQVGWTRARRLADLFAPLQGTPRPGILKPMSIYAARSNNGGEGARTRETVAPLAQRLGITVNTSYGKGDETALIAEVASKLGPTLGLLATRRDPRNGTSVRLGDSITAR